MSVKMLGEELKIKFNLAVEICYEQITGNAFDLDALKMTSNAIALYYAAIITNNPETSIKIEDLLCNATGQEISALSKAVFSSIDKWCKGAKPNEEESSEQEKNA